VACEREQILTFSRCNVSHSFPFAFWPDLPASFSDSSRVVSNAAAGYKEQAG
jgi:hypothetical protein